MKRAIAICLAALVLSAFGDDPYVYEFAPEALEPHLRDASQSKFFWAADGNATNGGVSYYRHTFTLDSKPSKAMLKAQTAKVGPDMSDDEVNEVYEKGAKVWMGLSHEIDALRREWLLGKLTGR